MTKDEIKALIAAKIAGQGSAVDVASALPTILDAIIDTIPEIKPAEPIVIPESIQFGYSIPKADMLAAGLTEKDLEDLMSGARPIFLDFSATKVLAFPSYTRKPQAGDILAMYGGIFPNEDAEVIMVKFDGADYIFTEYII